MKKLFSTFLKITFGISIFILLFILHNILPSKGYFGYLISFIIITSCFLTLIFLYSKYTQTNSIQNLKDLFSIKKIFYSTLYFVILTLLYFSYSHFFTQNEFLNFTIYKFSISVFSLTALSVIISAALEEFLFRYYIFSILFYNNKNIYFSIILSGIIFALIHIFTYDLEALLYVFFVGVCFNLLYIITGNLLSCISLHFTINFFSELNIKQDTSYDTPNLIELLTENPILNIILLSIISYWILSNHIFKQKFSVIEQLTITELTKAHNKI